MHAPPITFWFSPISSATTTITTTNPLAGPQVGRLTLKPTLSSPTRSSMTQNKRSLSHVTHDQKKSTSTKNSGSVRSSTTSTPSQPPVKKRKLDSDVKRRVKLPLRSNDNNTLVRSRVDGRLEIAGARNQQEKPVLQLSIDRKTAEKVVNKTDQNNNVKKLRIEIDNASPNSPIDMGFKQDAPINGNEHKDDSKRSLRSHDGGSRSKSELAQYFPNFDEIINPDGKDKELLTSRTRLFITDEPPKTSGSAQFVLPTPTSTRAPSFSVSSPQQPRPHPSSNFTFEKITLRSSAKNEVDPLQDSFYEVAHRRAERQEKQLRNIERERAQHEKVQLERLQEGLLGPDWLKIMGISGITEGGRKKWDDARDYFLTEVQCLLDKFARWKEEERRRKLLEVRKRKEAEEEDENEDGEEETVDEGEEADGGDPTSSQSSPDAAAHQLQLESLSASAGGKAKASRSRKPSKRALEATSPPATPSKRRVKANVAVVVPEIPTGPFTSFFAKPHQRAAALDKNRRTGRTRWAFGHPVPDMAEMPFSLPKTMTSEDARKASARLRRGMRRGRE